MGFCFFGSWRYLLFSTRGGRVSQSSSFTVNVMKLLNLKKKTNLKDKKFLLTQTSTMFCFFLFGQSCDKVINLFLEKSNLGCINCDVGFFFLPWLPCRGLELLSPKLMHFCAGMSPPSRYQPSDTGIGWVLVWPVCRKCCGRCIGMLRNDMV